MPVKFTLWMTLSIAGLVLSCLLALWLGARDIHWHDLWLAVSAKAPAGNALMLREIRFPRVAAAVVVGAAFAVSGAIMQGITRNPLADPGLLGLTAGANLALTLALAFMPGINNFGIMIACFIGAALGTVLVLLLASAQKSSFSAAGIILAGSAVTAFLFAIATFVALVTKLSKDVSMWTAGGLIGTTWSHVLMIAPIILLGIVIACLYARNLNILSLNDETALGLGQKLGWSKLVCITLVIILTGAAVALVGNMAFVGLMIPHIVRRLVGVNYRYVLPVSALVGAAFLLIADMIGRTVFAPYETPLVAITAVLGLPFFLFIIYKGGKRLP